MVSFSNKFFNQVMAFKSPPSGIAEGIQRVAPLEDRTRRTLKKLFLIVTETESGDPESQKRSFYEKHLKKLNRSELSRLMKKIRQIAALFMEDSEEKEQFEKLAEETISKILEDSAKLTDALHKKILKQLKKFQGLSIKGDEVSYSHKKFSLHLFVKENFSKIADEYDHFVQEGMLIPRRAEKQGTSFIKHTIKDTFK